MLMLKLQLGTNFSDRERYEKVYIPFFWYDSWAGVAWIQVLYNLHARKDPPGTSEPIRSPMAQRPIWNTPSSTRDREQGYRVIPVKGMDVPPGYLRFWCTLWLGFSSVDSSSLP